MVTDSVTILRTRGRLLAAKTHRKLSAGGIRTEPYSRAKTFDAETVDVGSIDDLVDLLSRVEADPSAFVIRAHPRAGAELRGVRRLKAESGGIFEPADSHRWIALDLDDLNTPISDAVEVDEDGSVVGVLEVSGYIRSIIETHLPSYFHDSTTYYQLTSSAGVKPWSQVRLRLWFWLSGPVADQQLHDVWSRHHVTCVDPVVFRDVQPIYTASPRFVGMADPCAGWRSGVLVGSSDSVTISTEHLTEPVEVVAARARRSAAPIVPSDGGRAWRYAVAALDGKASDILGLTDGRYAALQRGAFALAGYADALEGRGDEYAALVAEHLREVANRVGATDKHGVDSIDRMLLGAITAGRSKAIPIPIDDTPSTSRRSKRYHPPTPQGGYPDAVPVDQATPSNDEQAWFDAAVHAYGQQHMTPAERAQQHLLDVREHVDAYEEICTRYTTDADVLRVQRKYPDHIVLFSGDVGTAKTTAAAARYSGVTHLKIIAPQIALTESLGRKFDAAHYLDLDTTDRASFAMPTGVGAAYRHRYVTTFDSCDKVAYTPKHVVIDEVDGGLRRLMGRTVSNGLEIFERLRADLANADTAVAMTAYPDLATVMLLQSASRDPQAQRKVVLLRNTYQVAQGNTYTRYKSKAALLDAVFDAVEAGRRIALASDSTSFLKATYARLTRTDPALRIMLITADNKADPDQAAFLDDPNSDAKNYDVILYSPVIGAGFSVDAGHGFDVYAYLCALAVAPRDGIQLIHRFREIQHLHIAVENRRVELPTDPKKIRRDYQDAWQAELAAMKKRGTDAVGLGRDGRYAFRDQDFEQLHATVTACDNAQRLDFAGYFFDQLHATGRASVGPMIEDRAGAADRLKTAADQAVEVDVDAIADAPDLTHDEYKELDRRHALTSAENAAKQRYNLLEPFGAHDPVAPPRRDDVRSLALVDRKHQARVRVSRAALARADDPTLDYLVRREVARFARDGRQRVARSQRRLYYLQGEAFGLLLDAARIDPITLTSRHEYGDDDLAPFFDRIATRRRQYSGVFSNIPRRNAPTDKWLQWFGQQLYRIGFRTTSRQVTDPDGTRYRMRRAHYDPVLAWQRSDAPASLLELYEARQAEKVNRDEDAVLEFAAHTPVISCTENSVGVCSGKARPGQHSQAFSADVSTRNKPVETRSIQQPGVGAGAVGVAAEIRSVCSLEAPPNEIARRLVDGYTTEDKHFKRLDYSWSTAWVEGADTNERERRATLLVTYACEHADAFERRPAPPRPGGDLQPSV